MDLGIRDRVALVAASSQGLGLAVARGLAQEGAKLALCARTPSALDAAAEEIRRDIGTEVMTCALDVTIHDGGSSLLPWSSALAASISAWPTQAVRRPKASPKPPL